MPRCEELAGRPGRILQGGGEELASNPERAPPGSRKGWDIFQATACHCPTAFKSVACTLTCVGSRGLQTEIEVSRSSPIMGVGATCTKREKPSGKKTFPVFRPAEHRAGSRGGKVRCEERLGRTPKYYTGKCMSILMYGGIEPRSLYRPHVSGVASQAASKT